MAHVYVPKGTKRKSKIQLAEAAAKYLTNGRYDQRKSDMVAVTHKEMMVARQKQQAKKRKHLAESAKIFASMEALVAKTLVWEGVNDHRTNSNQTMITHGRREIPKKEGKVRHFVGANGQ